MGGEIDYSALGLVAELLGCDDLDGLAAGLQVIRKHRNEKDR